MAATVGTYYKVTIEVATTEDAAAKLVSLEKGTYTCDSADANFTRVVKATNGAGIGAHVGAPLMGDRYVVTLGSPTTQVTESTATIEDVVELAGEAVDAYEGYAFYE